MSTFDVNLTYSNPAKIANLFQSLARLDCFYAAVDILPDSVNIRRTASFDADSSDQKQRKKSRIDLSKIGIYPGDVLTYRDDPEVTAVVVEGSKVDYTGRVMSLTAAATEVLKSRGGNSDVATGTVYWCFDGEQLWRRRERLEGLSFQKDTATDSAWEISQLEAVPNDLKLFDPWKMDFRMAWEKELFFATCESDRPDSTWLEFTGHFRGDKIVFSSTNDVGHRFEVDRDLTTLCYYLPTGEKIEGSLVER
jgi:hypothetical protein